MELPPFKGREIETGETNKILSIEKPPVVSD